MKLPMKSILILLTAICMKNASVLHRNSGASHPAYQLNRIRRRLRTGVGSPPPADLMAWNNNRKKTRCGVMMERCIICFKNRILLSSRMEKPGQFGAVVEPACARIRCFRTPCGCGTGSGRNRMAR